MGGLICWLLAASLLPASALSFAVPCDASLSWQRRRITPSHSLAALRGGTQRPGLVAMVAKSEDKPQTASSRGGSDEGDATGRVVYFVMGGPGSGKGTQCAKLVERFGMVHLSAGDLLRAEVASGSELGQEISAVINQGQIVASETTVALLRAAMDGQRGPFLIDGFPRSISNLEAFEAEMGCAAFMLFLEVSEEEMEARLLKRGETSGRTDDNRETIIKRFRTFIHESMPVIDRLKAQGCLRTVDAGASEEVVFSRVCEAFDDQPGLHSDGETEEATHH